MNGARGSPQRRGITVSKPMIPDEAARRHALDPARSFIVQAPAGAGKTELLTQRFLTLLAVVDRPEEILAITFTKKAAAEMRARVLEALARAADDTPPEADHERRTWELARRARERDVRFAWRIEENPARLGIQTIDSLCLGLVSQMPLLSRFGAPPMITDDAAELYRLAAHATLALLNDPGDRASAIASLLRHLDNDARRAAMLLADMLERRDQWLRRVGDRDRLRRETLETALANVVRDALAQLCRALPPDLAGEIAYNADAAAQTLRASGLESGILACRDLRALPTTVAVEHLEVWLGVAELLLTEQGAWRRSITKKQGFPAKTDGNSPAQKKTNEQAKVRVGALLARLADYPEFGIRLHALRMLPPLHYDDAQWHILQALVEVLPLAAAQLKLTFAEQGRVDFTEVAQGALSALGEPEAPTDLLLALDYRLRHVLVDEFQDTSVSQFELLERLTAGWSPGDGRTLFLVGDPMQSIYRFREAEVGLYLRAVQNGIGAVPLTRLTLSANFRSQAGIVAWVNESFRKIFPAEEDIAAGAVPYAPLESVNPSLEGDAVTVVTSFGADWTEEARRIVDIVRASRARNERGSIAVLVRSRDHLASIVPALKRARLAVRAIEIERLAERQIVQDLLALTRALMHIADRPAWLAVLRAPWCGMTLEDLHALGADTNATLWEAIHDETRIARLSADGRRRLFAARDALSASMAEQGRVTLRRQVEGAWFALGGPACAGDATDLADAEVYLELLETLDDGSTDIGHVAAQAMQLFAAPDLEADDRLQVMTIHKAKGLEFDTVIVPGLGRRLRSEKVPLLQWTERTRGDGRPDLLLAPVHAVGSQSDPISQYLRALDDARARHEDARLLYVAVTRARERLYLFGHVDLTERDGQPEICVPVKGSLLKTLWPVVESQFTSALTSVARERRDVETDVDWSGVQDQRRLAADWSLPSPPPSIAADAYVPTVASDEAVEFVWVGDTARHVGTVVHRWLVRMGSEGVGEWSAARIAAQRPIFKNSLGRLGVPDGELPRAIEQVETALNRVLADERARWLLQPHVEARSEYGLTGVLDGRVVSVVLDRTFVDNDGVRWIVDYKTGAHGGGGAEEFLDSERNRYTAQLHRYARLLRLKEKRPIRLGLYFPMLHGWREWSFEGE
jgi:ATP-dependent exoDNAse (exonuclease V) beta subunit